MISFVILHYQAIDETSNCIDTIFKYVKNECKVIVIDNGSPNGTGKELETLYCDNNNVNIFLMDKNLGFAKGNNIGYRAAKQNNPDFIVVMNNDVFIQQYDLESKITQAYKNYKFDVLGPDIYSTRKKMHQNPQREKNFSLKELEREERKLEFKDKFSFLLRGKYMLKKSTSFVQEINEYKEVVTENVILHGACYVFSKSYIDAHKNCFYNNTFMYYESYILHFLGQRENLKFIYEPQIKVIHHEDVSTNLTYKSMYSKSKFVNKCLLESCREFIKIIHDEKVRLDS